MRPQHVRRGVEAVRCLSLCLTTLPPASAGRHEVVAPRHERQNSRRSSHPAAVGTPKEASSPEVRQVLLPSKDKNKYAAEENARGVPSIYCPTVR